ncbi:MAG TPA: phosphatidate cytidylyltransferase, partial [Hydrogenophaga sp.]
MTSFLRDLTADQQVSLLFVLLFGFLTLTSTALLLLSMRERPAHDDEPSGRSLRLKDYQGLVRTSWLMALVFWLAWAAGDGVATTLFALVSFLVLREFISLSPTRRGDHRSLLLAFFVVLPLQYLLVWTEHFNLFTVFIPVYVFLAIPTTGALGNDPQHFLARNAKLQWGIMVCVYGMSHVPALLLLDFPRYSGRSAFLVFFLVMVVQTTMLVQHIVSRHKGKAVAPAISASFNWYGW